MTKTIAIIAALPEEADAFMPGQGETEDSSAPFPIRSIGNIHITICGIGKVHAAAATMMMAQRYSPELIAMTGTCGRVSDIEGDSFWIAEAVQHDYGIVKPDGFGHYKGGEWPMGPEGHPPFTAMPDPGSKLPHARIGSGDAFIACADHSARIVTGLGIDLVDMEIAAMAQVAVTLDLPWCAIKSVTDEADGEVEGAFIENLKRAAAKSAEALGQVFSHLD